jgi:hypothetical protein
MTYMSENVLENQKKMKEYTDIKQCQKREFQICDSLIVQPNK